MKLKSLVTLLTLVGLGASCSTEDIGGGSNTGIEGRSEIQIAFSGTGENQEYTRAIASTEEDEIKTLQVYLFAASSAAGPYYYLETWNEGTAFDPAAPANLNFKKQNAGTGWKASIYPGELKGLPYLKLLCVANNGAKAGGTTDGIFYDEDGATPKAALVKVTTDAGSGAVTNESTATTEATFKAAYTQKLNAGTDDTGIISVPMLMSGEGATRISGGVTKVDIVLKRAVARFDIENNLTKSGLTITKLSMGRGRASGGVFKEATPTVVDEADLATSPLLTTYRATDFTQHTGANLGVTTSAFYAYPNLDTDKAYLIIEGTFKSPLGGNQVPVTYHVNIARAGAAPTDPAVPIALKANSRYKLKITDVTQSNVYGTFEVVDWTSGGGINVKPENGAPVFVGNEAFTAEAPNAVPTELKDAEEKVYGYEVVGDNGAFFVQIAATGKVTAVKAPLTRAGEDAWLSIESGETAEEIDGVWYTKFKLSYSNAIGNQPVAITFINSVAPSDPALQTTVNFYAPKAVPSFAAAAAGHSKGNTVDVVDPKAPKATIYAVKNGYVLFDITSIEGVKVISTATGYSATLVESKGFVHTYKIAVADQINAAGGTVVFANAGDETKESTLTITKADPTLKFTEVSDVNNAVSAYVPGTESPFVTTGKLNIDLDLLDNTNGYEFKVEGAGATGVTVNCAWLDITVNALDGGASAAVKLTKKAGVPVNYDDFNLVFVNNLTDATKNIAAPGLTITLHKDYSKPAIAAAANQNNFSTFNKGLQADLASAAKSIEMYKVNGSKVAVKMTCADAAAFDAVTGITVAKVGATDEYTITVDDASKFFANSTVLTAYNTAAKTADAGTDRKDELTITWMSAAIDVALTNDGSGSVAQTKVGDDIIYTIDTDALPGAGFIFTVKAPEGATTDMAVLTAATGIVKAHLNNAGDGTLAAGAIETYQLKAGDGADEVTMTFKNAITGGGDQKVIFKKKI